MDLVDSLVGEATMAGGVPPVTTSQFPVIGAKDKSKRRLDKLRARRPDLDLKESLLLEDDVVPVMVPGKKVKDKMRGLDDEEDDKGEDPTMESFVGRLIEDDDSIIPSDAVEVEFTATIKGVDDNVAKKADEVPEEPIFAGDALMSPVITLIAPDVTPNADVPLDPSSAPRAKDPALDVVLGKEPAPVSSPAPAPASPQNFLQSFGLDTPPNGVASESLANSISITEVVASATTAGIPMPEHKGGDGSKVLAAFRRFGPSQM